MCFEIIGEIEAIEVIARGGGIRDIMRIQNNLVMVAGASLKVLGKFDLKMEGYVMPSCTGTKHTVSAERK